LTRDTFLCFSIFGFAAKTTEITVHLVVEHKKIPMSDQETNQLNKKQILEPRLGWSISCLVPVA